MKKDEFLNSLSEPSPPIDYNDYWKAIWYIFNDDWQAAHEIVDGPSGTLYAWMHAIVHQMEGDTWNANYWYRRANRNMNNPDIESEKLKVLEELLNL